MARRIRQATQMVETGWLAHRCAWLCAVAELAGEQVGEQRAAIPIDECMSARARDVDVITGGYNITSWSYCVASCDPFGGVKKLGGPGIVDVSPSPYGALGSSIGMGLPTPPDGGTTSG